MVIFIFIIIFAVTNSYDKYLHYFVFCLQANITPTEYTKTIGIGESVTFRVTSTVDNLRWIHNNGEIIAEWNDRTEIAIDNIRLADAGIYECFEDGKREMGQHAIMRLIVRGMFVNDVDRNKHVSLC